MLAYALFAFFSGIAALVYQVVWTRQVALLLGSQIEAISIVLVAFFGGLAAGSRYFGARADRARSPQRLFGGLEMAGGLLAMASPFLLQGIGGLSPVALPPTTRLLFAGIVLFPVPFLLGGTAPALTRCAVREITRTAAGAGWIVGANTAGAVLGVVLAVLAIPVHGLRATLLLAGCLALVTGLTAWVIARPGARPGPVTSAHPPVPSLPLAAAFVAGLSTLAYEVLVARSAALLLGSTLYAWGCVLALLLAGLAAGTAFFGHRAAGTERPAFELGLIEAAAALAIAAGLSWLVPDYAMAAKGVTIRTLARVSLCVLPPAFLMGAAFPYFVRLAVRSFESLGRAFGTVSAFNTAGGIFGSLLAPFLFLPFLGLIESLLLCACLNMGLGALFLVRGAPARGRGWLGALAATVAVVLVAVPAFRPPPATPGRRIIHVDDGAQASVAVVRAAAGRELIVDGDPEAGTTLDALETETLLALLPIALNPQARDFLEVGLGSGITLGTAARFPLRRIDCAEIASSVIAAGRFFEPENGEVTRGNDPRVRIHHDDGRAFLARNRDAYDIVVANTLHPWSIGATGLYSREYFERIRGSLRAGGIAVQWVPIARIGADQLGAILRTFFAVFEEGGVWWGAKNLFLLGRESAGPPDPSRPAAVAERLREAPDHLWKRAGLDGPQELPGRRLAGSRAARAFLGAGEILTDDLPALETGGARLRGARPEEEVLVLLEGLANAGAKEDPVAEPLAEWISARLARKRGLAETSNRLEARAEKAGLALARRSRIARLLAGAGADLRHGRAAQGERALRALLRKDPDHQGARYALAGLAIARNDFASAEKDLEILLRHHPGFADGWNALGVARRNLGDRAGAREAFARAQKADPYFPEALANAGLVAAEMGDLGTAREMLERLRVLSPAGPTPEGRALREALDGP